MEKNCQSCYFSEGAFMGPCFVPWCKERDESISFLEEESCPDFSEG